MKTTIELPDDLLREVKRVAAAEHTTMRELMVEGLRSELERRRAPRQRVDFVFRAVDGEGLAPDVDAARAVELSYGLPL